MKKTLTNTIDKRELDSFLTSAQQESLIRIKYDLLYIGDAEMDAILSGMSAMPKEAIDAALCKSDFFYFCDNFMNIADSEESGWTKFKLWDVQRRIVMKTLSQSKKTEHPNRIRMIIPKTRRVGITWLLGIARTMWQAIYRPDQNILVYSLRERAADQLLSTQRFRGAWDRLPKHITVTKESPDGVRILPQGKGSNRRKIVFTNKSVISSMNPKEGDGEGAQYTFIDEADFYPELPKTLEIVDPATEYGVLILASRVNKHNGDSKFKQIVRRAKDDPESEFELEFVPWHAPPGRTQKFYERMKLENDIDELYSNYPATLEEAIAPAQLDKRIPTEDLEQCLTENKPIENHEYIRGMVRHHGLKVFKMPQFGTKYFIGADTAQGDETSDNSSTFVIDEYGEDVANITGKFHPTQQANQIVDLSKAYNNARALIESNFHGFHTIQWLLENGHSSIVLRGQKKNQMGWQTNRQSKESLYVELAELAKNRGMRLNDNAAFRELQSVNKHTLRAPVGYEDDRAMAYALAQMARIRSKNIVTLRVIDLEW